MFGIEFAGNWGEMADSLSPYSRVKLPTGIEARGYGDITSFVIILVTLITISGSDILVPGMRVSRDLFSLSP